MLTDSPPSPGSGRRVRTVARLAEAAVLVAWFLFVLRYQYGAAWLGSWDFGLDVLFLAAFGAAVTARLVERRGAPGARAVILRVALAGVATVLALVAAEYALRFTFRDVRSSADGRDYFGRHAVRVPARLNSLGFREREVPPKEPGRFRIAVIGDSFTYGNGLEERDRLSNVLEAHLGPSYEVFNFGKPGNDTRHHLRVLERALEVSPDFVLLQLFVNDFETRTMQRPRPYPLLPGSADPYLHSSSALYGLVKARWNRAQEVLGITESFTSYMARHLADPRSPHSVTSSSELRGFFQRASAAGVRAGAVMFPAADALRPGGRDYPFSYLHERVKQACDDQGVTCSDLLGPFSAASDPRVWWVSPFDAHPSAAANRRAAAEVLRVFGHLWNVR